MGVSLKKFSAFLVFLTAITCKTTTAQSDDLLGPEFLANIINLFSSRFFDEVTDQIEDKNFILSPLPVYSILALLAMGAKNETQKEIDNVLYMPEIGFTEVTINETLHRLNRFKHITVELFNKIYITDDPSYQLSPEFGHLSNIFSADVANRTLTKSGVGKEMNTWVELCTAHHSDDDDQTKLDEPTRLFLGNIIYFKADWYKKFNRKYTMPGFFHNENSVIKQVPMMRQLNHFLYARVPELNAKIIELPYAGFEAKMVIILPDKINGLADIEKQINSPNITEYSWNLRFTQVYLRLPKFNFETKIKLNPIIKELGARKVFSEKDADLSGVLKTTQPLYVANAFLRALIHVDEDGTEITFGRILKPQSSVAVNDNYGYPEYEHFAVNRPFYFIIRDYSGNVLFNGKVIEL